MSDFNFGVIEFPGIHLSKRHSTACDGYYLPATSLLCPQTGSANSWLINHQNMWLNDRRNITVLGLIPDNNTVVGLIPDKLFTSSCQHNEYKLKILPYSYGILIMYSTADNKFSF